MALLGLVVMTLFSLQQSSWQAKEKRKAPSHTSQLASGQIMKEGGAPGVTRNIATEAALKARAQHQRRYVQTPRGSAVNYTAMAAARLAQAESFRKAAVDAVAAATNRVPTPQDATDGASPFFDNLFAKTQHPEGKWKLWNRLDVLVPPNGGTNCTWATFRDAYNLNQRPYMCVYPKEDDNFVSGSIISSGSWGECPPLTKLFYQWMKQNPHQKEEDMIFLDVGANIGTCVMQMLYTTKVKLIIFEPHPLNLQKLTSTLVAQPMEVRKRVALFPVGAGQGPVESPIYMASNNRGNSVVGKVIKDTESQPFEEAATVYVEAIDDLFAADADAFTVPLMKMDIQGYECFAMDGMQRVLQQINVIKTEATALWLDAQGCSEQGLKDRITNAGFSITSIFNGEIVGHRGGAPRLTQSAGNAFKGQQAALIKRRHEEAVLKEVRLEQERLLRLMIKNTTASST
eukprot:CAMPEP_0172476166 /NCGR_PEP_ID=MMETSP1065-20121228/70242_1 /TAXON_ID=265537 /ORGANISM="Amphiprora paludosa, Strain CCMP125" /LENGTH=457 /DNA_ID=CAMNT_0013234387 /DNA_START=104 /DNA_END=1477 /DNA_ORIENTATION=-